MMSRDSDKVRPQSHGLGLTRGSMIDHHDGTVSYRPTGEILDAFRVRVSEITGFSQQTSRSRLERTLQIFGNGTILASVNVNWGTPEKIEAWISARPDFNPERARGSAPAAPVSVADELAKLAHLRDAGILEEQEFAAQKARLLGI